MTADPVLEDPEHFIALARNCWLVDFASKGTKRLHAVRDGEWTDEHRQSIACDWAVIGPLRFACGLIAGWAAIPGVGDRLGGKRCGNCCAALGLPPGIGSPLNDPECRVLLGLDARQ